MVLDRGISNLEDNLEFATMLNLLDQADGPARVRAYAGQLRPGIQLTNWFDADDFQPIQMYLRWGDLGVILLGGSSRLTHAANYQQALQTPINPHSDGGLNPYVQLAASNVRSRMEAEGLRSVQQQIYVGHSLGGAIAIGAMAQARQQVPNDNAFAITFGSPKPGPVPFANLVYRSECVRWMNDDDPVSHIPPRHNESNLYWALLPPGARSQVLQYVQPAGGIVLKADGNVETLNEPVISNLGLGISLPAWLLALATDSQSSHSMQTYVNRLNRRAALFTGAAPNLVTTRHAERAEHISQTALRLEAERAAAELRASMRPAGETTVVIPELWQFVAKKRGALWCVDFREQQVFVGPNRRRARHIARLGNVWLEALQRMGQVDITGLLKTFDIYLGDASDPTSGFRPTMRI
jgi:pimeloyl-ACP methyl ester carboxylesterase